MRVLDLISITTSETESDLDYSEDRTIDQFAEQYGAEVIIFKSEWGDIIADTGITPSYTPTEFVSDIVRLGEAISNLVKDAKETRSSDENW